MQKIVRITYHNQSYLDPQDVKALLCALAIKTFKDKMPNSYGLMYATAIEQNLEPGLLQKPDKYEHAQLRDTY